MDAVKTSITWLIGRLDTAPGNGLVIDLINDIKNNNNVPNSIQRICEIVVDTSLTRSSSTTIPLFSAIPEQLSPDERILYMDILLTKTIATTGYLWGLLLDAGRYDSSYTTQTFSKEATKFVNYLNDEFVKGIQQLSGLKNVNIIANDLRDKSISIDYILSDDLLKDTVITNARNMRNIEYPVFLLSTFLSWVWTKHSSPYINLEDRLGYIGIRPDDNKITVNSLGGLVSLQLPISLHDVLDLVVTFVKPWLIDAHGEIDGEKLFEYYEQALVINRNGIVDLIFQNIKRNIEFLPGRFPEAINKAADIYANTTYASPTSPEMFFALAVKYFDTIKEDCRGGSVWSNLVVTNKYPVDEFDKNRNSITKEMLYSNTGYLKNISQRQMALTLLPWRLDQDRVLLYWDPGMGKTRAICVNMFSWLNKMWKAIESGEGLAAGEPRPMALLYIDTGNLINQFIGDMFTLFPGLATFVDPKQELITEIEEEKVRKPTLPAFNRPPHPAVCPITMKVGAQLLFAFGAYEMYVRVVNINGIEESIPIIKFIQSDIFFDAERKVVLNPRDKPRGYTPKPISFNRVLLQDRILGKERFKWARIEDPYTGMTVSTYRPLHNVYYVVDEFHLYFKLALNQTEPRKAAIDLFMKELVIKDPVTNNNGTVVWSSGTPFWNIPAELTPGAETKEAVQYHLRALCGVEVNPVLTISRASKLSSKIKWMLMEAKPQEGGQTDKLGGGIFVTRNWDMPNPLNANDRVFSTLPFKDNAEKSNFLAYVSGRYLSNLSLWKKQYGDRFTKYERYTSSVHIPLICSLKLESGALNKMYTKYGSGFLKAISIAEFFVQVNSKTKTMGYKSPAFAANALLKDVVINPADKIKLPLDYYSPDLIQLATEILRDYDVRVQCQSSPDDTAANINLIKTTTYRPSLRSMVYMPYPSPIVISVVATLMDIIDILCERERRVNPLRISFGYRPGIATSFDEPGPKLREQLKPIEENGYSNLDYRYLGDNSTASDIIVPVSENDMDLYNHYSARDPLGVRTPWLVFLSSDSEVGVNVKDTPLVRVIGYAYNEPSYRQIISRISRRCSFKELDTILDDEGFPNDHTTRNRLYVIDYTNKENIFKEMQTQTIRDAFFQQTMNFNGQETNMNSELLSIIRETEMERNIIEHRLAIQPFINTNAAGGGIDEEIEREFDQKAVDFLLETNTTPESIDEEFKRIDQEYYKATDPHVNIPLPSLRARFLHDTTTPLFRNTANITQLAAFQDKMIKDREFVDTKIVYLDYIKHIQSLYENYSGNDLVFRFIKECLNAMVRLEQKDIGVRREFRLRLDRRLRANMATNTFNYIDDFFIYDQDSRNDLLDDTTRQMFSKKFCWDVLFEIFYGKESNESSGYVNTQVMFPERKPQRDEDYLYFSPYSDNPGDLLFDGTTADVGGFSYLDMFQKLDNATGKYVKDPRPSLFINRPAILIPILRTSLTKKLMAGMNPSAIGITNAMVIQFSQKDFDINFGATSRILARKITLNTPFIGNTIYVLGPHSLRKQLTYSADITIPGQSPFPFVAHIYNFPINGSFAIPDTDENWLISFTRSGTRISLTSEDLRGRANYTDYIKHVFPFYSNRAVLYAPNSDRKSSAYRYKQREFWELITNTLNLNPEQLGYAPYKELRDSYQIYIFDQFKGASFETNVKEHVEFYVNIPKNLFANCIQWAENKRKAGDFIPYGLVDMENISNNMDEFMSNVQMLKKPSEYDSYDGVYFYPNNPDELFTRRGKELDKNSDKDILVNRYLPFDQWAIGKYPPRMYVYLKSTESTVVRGSYVDKVTDRVNLVLTRDPTRPYLYQVSLFYNNRYRPTYDYYNSNALSEINSQKIINNTIKDAIDNKAWYIINNDIEQILNTTDVPKTGLIEPPINPYHLDRTPYQYMALKTTVETLSKNSELVNYIMFILEHLVSLGTSRIDVPNGSIGVLGRRGYQQTPPPSLHTILIRGYVPRGTPGIALPWTWVDVDDRQHAYQVGRPYRVFSTKVDVNTNSRQLISASDPINIGILNQVVLISIQEGENTSGTIGFALPIKNDSMGMYPRNGIRKTTIRMYGKTYTFTPIQQTGVNYYAISFIAGTQALTLNEKPYPSTTPIRPNLLRTMIGNNLVADISGYDNKLNFADKNAWDIGVVNPRDFETPDSGFIDNVTLVQTSYIHTNLRVNGIRRKFGNSIQTDLKWYRDKYFSYTSTFPWTIASDTQLTDKLYTDINSTNDTVDTEATHLLDLTLFSSGKINIPSATSDIERSALFKVDGRPGYRIDLPRRKTVGNSFTDDFDGSGPRVYPVPLYIEESQKLAEFDPSLSGMSQIPGFLLDGLTSAYELNSFMKINGREGYMIYTDNDLKTPVDRYVADCIFDSMGARETMLLNGLNITRATFLRGNYKHAHCMVLVWGDVHYIITHPYQLLSMKNVKGEYLFTDEILTEMADKSNPTFRESGKIIITGTRAPRRITYEDLLNISETLANIEDKMDIPFFSLGQRAGCDVYLCGRYVSLTNTNLLPKSVGSNIDGDYFKSIDVLERNVKILPNEFLCGTTYSNRFWDVYWYEKNKSDSKKLVRKLHTDTVEYNPERDGFYVWRSGISSTYAPNEFDMTNHTPLFVHTSLSRHLSDLWDWHSAGTRLHEVYPKKLPQYIKDLIDGIDSLDVFMYVINPNELLGIHYDKLMEPIDNILGTNKLIHESYVELMNPESAPGWYLGILKYVIDILSVYLQVNEEIGVGRGYYGPLYTEYVDSGSRIPFLEFCRTNLLPPEDYRIEFEYKNADEKLMTSVAQDILGVMDRNHHMYTQDDPNNDTQTQLIKKQTIATERAYFCYSQRPLL